MKSASYGDQIMTELGEKVLYGIAQAVVATRADLQDYRTERAAWVAQASERGLANWIHDRLWVHLLAQLGDLDEVNFSDRGPTREFRVGMRYLFRAKRHTTGDRVSSFPTQSALAFWSQNTTSLFPGEDEVRLAVGYRWDQDLRDIEDAVVSLRDAMDNPVWVLAVAFAPTTGAVELHPIGEDAPELPIITLAEDEDDIGDADQAESE